MSPLNILGSKLAIPEVFNKLTSTDVNEFIVVLVNPTTDELAKFAIPDVSNLVIVLGLKALSSTLVNTRTSLLLK